MEDEGSDSTLPSSSSAAPAAPLPPMIQRLLSGEGSALMKGSIPPPSDADGSDTKNSGDTSPHAYLRAGEAAGAVCSELRRKSFVAALAPSLLAALIRSSEYCC